MLRLDLTAGPRWLDLGHGVRLEVLPLNSTMMLDVWRDPVLAELDHADPSHRVAFVKAVARRAVVGWDGVGDLEGNPIEVTPQGIDALLDIWALYMVFNADFVNHGLTVVSEGNGSAPSRNGTSAQGATTAEPAASPVPTAPTS